MLTDNVCRLLAPNGAPRCPHALLDLELTVDCPAQGKRPQNVPRKGSIPDYDDGCRQLERHQRTDQSLRCPCCGRCGSSCWTAWCQYGDCPEDVVSAYLSIAAGLRTNKGGLTVGKLCRVKKERVGPSCSKVEVDARGVCLRGGAVCV